MKGYVKCIIAGAVILGIGIAVLIIALGVNGWSFDFKSTEYEMKTQEADKDYQNLNVDFNAGELEIVFYDGDKIKFDYPENNRYSGIVNYSDDAIGFENKKNFWFDWLSWSSSFPKTTISIPQTAKINLTVELNAGSVTIADGEFLSLNVKLNAGAIHAKNLKADSVNLDVNAGALNVTSLESPKSKLKVNAGSIAIASLTSDEIKTDTNAGKITLGVAGTATEYTVQIEKNAGSCNIDNHTGSNEAKSITGKMNAGTLEVNFLN